MIEYQYCATVDLRVKQWLQKIKESDTTKIVATSVALDVVVAVGIGDSSSVRLRRQ